MIISRRNAIQAGLSLPVLAIVGCGATGGVTLAQVTADVKLVEKVVRSHQVVVDDVEAIARHELVVGLRHAIGDRHKIDGQNILVPLVGRSGPRHPHRLAGDVR